MEKPQRTRFSEFTGLHDPLPVRDKGNPGLRKDLDGATDIQQTANQRKKVVRSEGKKYYDISFYVDSTTPKDWYDFFKKLSDFHTYATIFVMMKGRGVRYIIESNKHLENANAIFHPFRLTVVEKPEHAQQIGISGIKFIHDNELFEFA